MWRRGRLLFERLFDDTRSGALKRAAARAARRRVAAVRARRAADGTNVYNRAQYINAFIEAESARQTHARRLEEGATHEKFLLSLVDAAGARRELTPHGTTKISDVAFGSWREGDPALERACTSMDRTLHCIVRGATTPPAFSPEALRRGVPTHLAGVERLLQFFSGGDKHGRWSKRKLKHFADEMDSVFKFTCGGDSDITQRLMAMLLHVSASQHWSLALQLYNEVLLPFLQREQQQVNSAERSTATSMLVAVLCESIRSHHFLSETDDSGPTFHTVVELASATPHSLLPVAAAPLFSILRKSNNATWHDVVALAQRFQTPGAKRLYLPSIAWGEMMRAMHRTGASLADVQGVVDIITDPKRTKNAERHMHDTNIWNAYLCVSDWQHALEVYANNWKHYGVKETAATSAALMHSLLRDGQWERALRVFRRLQTKEGQLVTGTSGVFTALFRVLEQQGDWGAVTTFLTDFDHFLAHLGVPHDVWRDRPPPDAHFSSWMAFVGALRGCGHVTRELAGAMESSLAACDLRGKGPSRPAGRDVSFDDVVTAEALQDVM